VASVRQPNLAKSLICIKISAAVSAEEAATMLYKLAKAFSMDLLSGNEPQRISNAASKLICLLLDDGSSSIKRIGQLDGRQLSQSAWALFQVHTYCKSPEVRQLDLAIADQVPRSQAA